MAHSARHVAWAFYRASTRARTKRSLRALFVLPVLLALPLPTFAQGPAVFGPQRYDRTAGAPNTYTASFEACSLEATYELEVDNGEGGQGRVSSASISLNGTEIVGESDLNQKVTQVRKNVTLAGHNELVAKLQSGPGGFVTVAVRCKQGCVGIRITSPSPGSFTDRGQTIVRGDLLNVAGEVGVALKSSGAQGAIQSAGETQGGSFAGVVRLQGGMNTITATATDLCGLEASAASGLSPLTVTFRGEYDRAEPPAERFSWDLDGDGDPDHEGEEASEVSFTYESAGLFFPTLTVTDAEGGTYSETAIIHAFSRDEMDTLFRGKWAGMNAALRSQDIEGALDFVVWRSQPTYRTLWQAMGTHLPAIAREMGEIRPARVESDTAEYEIIATREGRTYSFRLLFVRDQDGFWKIASF